MVNVSLVREVIVVISKETGGWLLSKRVWIVTKSVKMNLSPTPSANFCDGLYFKMNLSPSPSANFCNGLYFKMNLSPTPSATFCNGLYFKMNYHLLPQQLSVMDFISELCEIQDITFRVFEPIKLTLKKKSWKFMIF